eukprot:COSAG01_NODE_2106_length_8416_cov_47.839485_1_plen_28_part_10
MSGALHPQATAVVALAVSAHHDIERVRV